MMKAALYGLAGILCGSIIVIAANVAVELLR